MKGTGEKARAEEVRVQRTQTTQAPQTDRWLTIDEAARLLGVGQSTLRRWSDAGLVPVYRTATARLTCSPCCGAKRAPDVGSHARH